MRRVWVAVAIVIALPLISSAIEPTELGAQLNLGLEPYRQDGRSRWWITVAAYGRISFDETWHLRIVAGSGISEFAPFADLGLVRVFTPSWMAEGNLRLEALPGRGLLSTARVGGRYVANPESDTRVEVATFPLGWTLTSHAQELRGDFFVNANLDLDVTIGSAEAGLIGQGVALSVLRRAPASEAPTIPLGGQWLLSAELITHIGVGL